MKKENSLVTILDVVVYSLVFGIIISGKMLGLQSYDLFFELVQEDGLAEYLTAFFLLATAVVFAFRTVRSVKKQNKYHLIFNAFMFLAFIFGAGEEISWGQRLLNTETGDFFQKYNYQGETNLHNLEVWGINLNKLIFSQLMLVALVFYFMLLPFLTLKYDFIRKLVIRFDVPVPKLHHAVIFILQNIFILWINLLKIDELHELSLGSIMFLILMAPATEIRGKAVRE
ncbi:MAG: hypothetical protein ACQETJ_02325 [Bacteroidota bacterium]